MPCLETQNLSHRYAAADPVLHQIGLQVPQGALYGFLGPNGAGKTTTLRLLLGLLRKQSGEIRIFGRPLERERVAVLRRVGALIEMPSLYEHLSAFENLRLVGVIHGLPRARLEEVLALVGLGAVAGKKVASFSLGMKQRLGIALALLHRPALLILDEPTNGLDPNGILAMRTLLTTLNREHGTTILISSHLLSEIEKLVSHAGIVHRGRLLFQGTLAELRQQRRRIVGVRLRTNDDARALVIVQTHAAAATLGEDGVEVRVASLAEIAALTRELIESGLDLHHVTPVGEDLEGIFMDMVRH